MTQTINYVAPTKLFMALTNACNVKCPHCLPDSKKAFKNELTTEQVFKVIKDAAGLGVPRIAFTGGEPTLRKDLPQFIKLANQYEMRVDLETSASLYKVGYIESLKDYGLSNLCLSLDGPTAESHDTFRGVPGLYQKVINAAIEGANLGLNVRVYCSVSRDNLDAALSLVDVLSEFKNPIQGLTFAPVTPVGRASKNTWLSPSPNEWIDFGDRFDKKYASIKDHTSMKLRIEKMFIRLYELETFMTLFPHDISCIARERRYLYINPIGFAYGCALLAGSDASLGNVKQDSIKKIWQESNMWSFFGNKAQGRDDLVKKCCDGCPALNYRNSGISNNFIHKKQTVNGTELIPVCPMIQTPQIDLWPELSNSA